MIRRAVAPMDGVKGGLRQPLFKGRRGVQGRPRLAQVFYAVDWGYVRLWLAVAATTYIVVRIALERAA